MIKEKLLINNQEKFTKQLYKIANILRWRTISFIQRVIFNKDKHYTEIIIEKRSGGFPRLIEAPSSTLKEIQREVLVKLLSDRNIYEVAHGFIKNKSIVTNAKKHEKKKIILKIDIKDFFHSISKEKVKEIFSLYRGLNKQCSNYLAEICTFKGRLPQGAPTSPSIANYVASNMDKRFYFLAKKSDITYTRYADDLIFSGDRIKKSLFNKIVHIIEEEGFKVNTKKTCWMRNMKRQKVTGIIVNEKASFGKKRYKSLSALIHSCIYGDLEEEKLKAIKEYGIKIRDLKKYLYGMVAFLNSIDSNKAEKLLFKLKLISEEKWITYQKKEEKKTREDFFIILMKKINNMNGRFTTPFFEGRNERFVSIVEPCHSLKDFNDICIDLGGLFDRINTKLLGLDGIEPINELEIWMKEKKYSILNLTILRDIKRLSNNYKRHEDLQKVEKILKRNGESLNNPDHNRLMDTLLKRLNFFLNELDFMFQKELKF